MKTSADILGPQRIDPKGFGNLLIQCLAPPAGLITHLFHDMLQHLQDAQAQNLAQMFFRSLMTLLIPRLFLQRHREVLTKISPQHLDGLPSHLVHTFTFPS